MPRSQQGELVNFDLEVERTLRKVPHTIKLETANVEILAVNEKKEEGLPPLPLRANRRMGDYALPFITGTQSSITRPAVTANNFKIKLNIIQMVQNNV